MESDIDRVTCEATVLLREVSPTRANDEMTVYLVALGILHGEKTGLMQGKDLAVEAIRDSVLGAVSALPTKGA